MVTQSATLANGISGQSRFLIIPLDKERAFLCAAGRVRKGIQGKFKDESAEDSGG
jgi:hypothetical protein